MKKTAFLCIAALLSVSAFSQKNNFAQHVNPFIGTGGHGHAFPGATVPFGMVQLSPDTRIDGSWDGCGGYHYSDNVIYGFSHTHLNGVGVSDFGDIMLMPTMGEPSFDNKDYSSPFSHTNEKASAGFYAVKLDKHNIDVRLTTSTRVGFHEYTFNKNGIANIILDLNHRDKLLQGEVKIIDSKTIEILRRSEAWARDQYVFARIEFNVPMQITKSKVTGSSLAGVYSGTEVAISFSKAVKKGEKILVKVALSPTGYEGAKLNMSEIKHWDFEKVKKDAETLWNKELSKIEVTSTDNEKQTIFYTALYHTMMQPNIAEDLDGKYRGRDNKIHVADTFDYYTVFSLWDTFRGAHPLYTLIDKKRTADYINTFLKQYEQGGRLPVWELASNETDCMIGYHSVSVIADAMAKRIKGFDYEKAFEAAKHSAMLDHLGLEAYKENGFISIDDEHESVSKTLEYAYDDWCIAQMAQILNKTEDYLYFMKRSQSWKNLFDAETGFMRPKKNGGWDKPFDPREVNNNFTEGNSWQYSFFVPQDISGMIDAYGGAAKFEAKLDEMFTAPSATTGREQVDITGLIGQYAHGNEPSHHMAYLYNYIGKYEKTNAKIKYILDTFYKNTPDGLIGNEDCGQMSAWYVLSSMGIYAVTPGNGHYTTTTPYFNKIKVKLDNNQSKTIVKGEPRNLFLSSDLKTEFNVIKTTKGAPIVTVPVIEAPSKTFKEKITIAMRAAEGDVIFYSVDNTKELKKYVQPFEIDKTSTLFAYAMNGDGVNSNTISATFFKKPNHFTIVIQSKYTPQYHAGGPEGLIDGVLGNENWRKGDWQGYQGQDFEAVIDLKQEQSISQISARFLQDTRAWILMPTKVEYYVSNDNVNFQLAATVNNTLDAKEYDTKIIAFDGKINERKARYVKVKAYSFGKLPEWHQGAGYDAYIFIDEITVK
ncbi:putative alpha-1,2-mannosidase [Flavobacterium cauense R2A-7]|uniref:Putative alpha-1,2-mannosidase n=1 Tax=Flavobacterium cauense R2A-7 TaxID=1341154 RepID=A0A562LNX0_9FLAO|nr:GH92 family glycosyl hydrolase [Flavobacterium cauense]KGO80310.1 alpha-mannosidase [Flavobacterium cauense R2A-7]TWI09312.1 putative alpha-1,2-mannosidase [Flavobacterium cauense R2A-7]